MAGMKLFLSSLFCKLIGRATDYCAVGNVSVNAGFGQKAIDVLSFSHVFLHSSYLLTYSLGHPARRSVSWWLTPRCIMRKAIFCASSIRLDKGFFRLVCQTVPGELAIEDGLY